MILILFRESSQGWNTVPENPEPCFGGAGRKYTYAVNSMGITQISALSNQDNQENEIKITSFNRNELC